MRIVFYSQHVLGVGHLFRSLEIVHALAGHEVTFVTGGAEVDLDLPLHAEQFRLPGLMMNEDFSRFIPVEPGAHMDDVLERRKVLFLDLMERVRPDVFLVELYPFGRKKFGFELLPILENAKAGAYGTCRSVCSLRDILVEKKKQAEFENRVLATLHQLFDGLLVHADPELIRLEETFPAASDIEIPIHYTGYVTPYPEPEAGAELAKELNLDETPLVVASAGGGSVGQELLHATLAASSLIAERHPHQLAVFTGPYAPDDDFQSMTATARSMPWASVKRFTSRFPSYLSAASLSVSLAGYNTTMNLLGAGTYGLVMPFDQNREQRMRAERLEQKGALAIVNSEDLAPERLAERMIHGLPQGASAHGIALNGAQRTAELLEEIGH